MSLISQFNFEKDPSSELKSSRCSHVTDCDAMSRPLWTLQHTCRVQSISTLFDKIIFDKSESHVVQHRKQKWFTPKVPSLC